MNETIDHALHLCDLLALDLSRLDDGTSDASRCAEFRLSIVSWLLFRKMKYGLANVPDDGVRWDANERGQLVRSVILPDAKIDWPSVPACETKTVQCVANGWERESWDGEWDGLPGRFFASERVLWWYDAALEFHEITVKDGDHEPQFEVVNAGFRVLKFSREAIEVTHER